MSRIPFVPSGVEGLSAPSSQSTEKRCHSWRSLLLEPFDSAQGERGCTLPPSFFNSLREREAGVHFGASCASSAAIRFSLTWLFGSFFAYFTASSIVFFRPAASPFLSCSEALMS